ncbi:cobyrinate a,c-diamide synthase [Treponema pedis]|uniref:Cobyrinic acid a,c-diamide synthase n=1 Tax=Treponema pedis str. T A4 TaxID=1291379 RepID=S6A3L0_9SPIR|nr:cobyrinate a,c-diamide synthase [Treponema pedis]AGT43661.1 cobyrinic acid a,c-diamide synthase [Treponema pedis str. T A4]
MKAVMISAPNSNSGKTIISAALLYSLKKRGFDISGFKTGPDQVDRKILETVSGKAAGNIDLFMMGKNGIKHALGFANSEYAIIEGVMGCFDGIGSTSENSSYAAAKELDINIILVYSPSGEMFTMIPKLKGMIDCSEKRICGIILNKISSKMFSLYKKMIEENLNLPVLGFFPNEEKLKIEDSGLGLNLNSELQSSEFLNLLDKTVSENIDKDKLLSLFKEVKTGNFTIRSLKKQIKTAIALDNAINLYYTENIFLLKSLGCVEYFSPIHDKNLPECNFLYFGSGNIKPFAKALSENKNMLNAVKSFAEKGGYILAEGEAACYLFEEFDGYEMCGIFKGKTESTKTLYNFGYKIIKLEKNCLLGKKGTVLHAAEYHKSKAITNEVHAFKVCKPQPYSEPESFFDDGYAYKNTLASFQNFNFTFCSGFLESIS